MDQKKLAFWLKVILIGVGICGAVVYFAVLPVLGDSVVYDYPAYSDCYWPWLIFLWLTAIPCYWVLGLGLQIAGRIGADNSFCRENAGALRTVSILAAADAGFFFLGQLLFFFLNMNHPGVLLLAQLVVFAGVAVSVAAAVLSHLVQKAALLREEHDLTV